MGITRSENSFLLPLGFQKLPADLCDSLYNEKIHSMDDQIPAFNMISTSNPTIWAPTAAWGISALPDVQIGMVFMKKVGCAAVCLAAHALRSWRFPMLAASLAGRTHLGHARCYQQDRQTKSLSNSSRCSMWPTWPQIQSSPLRCLVKDKNICFKRNRNCPGNASDAK